MLAKDPIPLSKIPDLCLMQRSIGLVTELWSPRFVTEYWNVFFPICHFDYCNELLAAVGWKRGCQPLSCPCSQNVTHCQTDIFSTCSSRESISGDSKHRGSWEYQLCLMVASCPSLRCSCRKKPVTCREAEGLVTELWSPGLVEEFSDLRWFHVTTVTTMNRFGDWAFNQLLGLEVGL